MSIKDLKGKQKLFVEYYCGEANLNATEACRLAGYEGNENVLGVQGFRNLRNAKIRAAIDEKLADHGMMANEVIVRLAEQARASVGDVLNSRGILDLEEAKRKGTDRLIKEITVIVDKTQKNVRYKYKIHDSQAALDKLARILGLYKDTIKHDIEANVNNFNLDVPEEVAQSMIAGYDEIIKKRKSE